MAELRLLGRHQLRRLQQAPLTYAEVGATIGGQLPQGYRWLDRRRQIGSGIEAFERAADLLFGWGMQLGSGLSVAAEAVEVRSQTVAEVRFDLSRIEVPGLGPVRTRLAGLPGFSLIDRLGVLLPVRVLATDRDDRQAWFSYGTLTGHAEIGEEQFGVDRDSEDRVWARIRAFSRPTIPFTGPLLNPIQNVATDGYLAALAAPAAAAGPGTR